MSSKDTIEKAKHLETLIGTYGYTIDRGILERNFNLAVDYEVRRLKQEGWSNAAICERSFEIEDEIWRNGFMIPTDDPAHPIHTSYEVDTTNPPMTEQQKVELWARIAPPIDPEQAAAKAASVWERMATPPTPEHTPQDVWARLAAKHQKFDR